MAESETGTIRKEGSRRAPASKTARRDGPEEGTPAQAWSAKAQKAAIKGRQPIQDRPRSPIVNLKRCPTCHPTT